MRFKQSIFALTLLLISQATTAQVFLSCTLSGKNELFEAPNKPVTIIVPNTQYIIELNFIGKEITISSKGSGSHQISFLTTQSQKNINSGMTEKNTATNLSDNSAYNAVSSVADQYAETYKNIYINRTTGDLIYQAHTFYKDKNHEKKINLYELNGPCQKLEKQKF